MATKDVFKFGLKIPHVIEGELRYERVRDNRGYPPLDEEKEPEKPQEKENDDNNDS